jgi:hypothetical protein
VSPRWCAAQARSARVQLVCKGGAGEPPTAPTLIEKIFVMHDEGLDRFGTGGENFVSPVTRAALRETVVYARTDPITAQFQEVAEARNGVSRITDGAENEWASWYADSSDDPNCRRSWGTLRPGAGTLCVAAVMVIGGWCRSGRRCARASVRAGASAFESLASYAAVESNWAWQAEEQQ